jgi:hypothetical protein
MSTTGLSGIQLAAALAEQIYHRGATDDPISLSQQRKPVGRISASVIRH